MRAIINNQSIMNNLGGYKSIELVFIDELSTFAVTSSGAFLRKISNTQRLLPLQQNGAGISVTLKTDGPGTLCTHKAEISILHKGLDTQLKAELDQVGIRGSVLIATTNNDEKRVYGNLNYPMFGTFSEIPGQKPADLRHYELSLSATCNHPALTLME